MTKKTKPSVQPVQKPELATIQIDAKYLRGLRHIAAKKDIRYYLNAVLLNATKALGKFYVATDGHRIAAILEPWRKDEEPQDLTVIIPIGVAEKATSILEQSSIAILKQVDALTWTLQGRSDISQTFKAIDAKYPEWQKVIPDVVTGKPGHYNWTYLHGFNQLVKEAFGYSFPVELHQNGEQAAIATCAADRNFLGVIMPMRPSGSDMPQWAIEAQKANVERKVMERLEADKRLRAEAKELESA